MNTRSIGLIKVNLKSAILVLVLTLSVFSMSIPFAVSAPDHKISSILAGSPMTEAEVDLLITTATNDYASVEAEILELGGQVRSEFHYVNALSASVPAGKVLALTDNEDVTMIYKDETRSLADDIPIVPELDPIAGSASAYLQEYESISLTPEMIEDIEPNNYWNPIAMGAELVWDATNDYGQESMVVIIDTGLWAGHFMFDGSSIIGGIDMSPDIEEPGQPHAGWNRSDNHWHGTHVAGIVASTGGILVPDDDLLALSIEYHTGMPLPPGDPYGYPGYKLISLLGMAWAADLYAIKVFPHTGAGVSESYVLAAMEYALDLKLVDGYDVDVISMSLGGPSRYDGRDVEDQLVDYITSHGITIVAAAGNEGPAQMTVGSPGSANTAITVGAAATPVQTRVYWDVAAYGVVGIGDLLFTSEIPQIYAFSSRGPTSDGRLKPTLSATGIFVMSAVPPQGVAWASGTSMATPAVSGAVALLNTYAEAFIPGATPEDYKQALKNGAVWLEGYNEYDQGAGFLNAYDALIELVNDPSIGDVADPLCPFDWLEKMSNIRMNPWRKTSTYETDIVDLSPGHKKDFVFKVTHLTESIELEITDVELGVDLGLNSFEVYIQSAKRTSYWYFIETANVWDDASFLITDYETTWTGDVSGVYADPTTRLAPIEPGYVKIVIENDWTSFDDISCHIKITVKRQTFECGPYKYVNKFGIIEDGESTDWMQIDVPDSAVAAEITLSWCRDWSFYPTSDLDFLVYWDEGYNFDGATWNSPERVMLENPTLLYVLIDGYSIYGIHGFFQKEPYLLRIKFTLG